jgi:hypothetical protein
MSKAAYFSYERHEDENKSPDACIVFTGPAKHDTKSIREKFQPCISSLEFNEDFTYCHKVNYQTDTSAPRCEIPPMIWSGGSSNNVPVATLHQVSLPQFENGRENHNKTPEITRLLSVFQII